MALKFIHGFFEFLCILVLCSTICHFKTYFKTLQVKLESFLLSPFPWSPMVRLSADRRGNTWSKTRWNLATAIHRCGMMALGTHAKLSFCDGGARSPAVPKKTKTIKVETRTCWLTSWGRNVLGGSHQFRVSPPWSRKQTFVYRLSREYLFCTYTYFQYVLNMCMCKQNCIYNTICDTTQDSRFKQDHETTWHHPPLFQFSWNNFKSLYFRRGDTWSTCHRFKQISPVDRGSQKKIQPWSNNPKASVKYKKVNFPIRVQIFLGFDWLGISMTSSRILNHHWFALNGFFG